MKHTPQRLTNPYKYSDSNKRYFTFEYYCRQKYGGRVVKIPLDAGFTCPNIDGTCAVGGCIYCSPSGSGDSIPNEKAIERQYELGRLALAKKWDVSRCVPYFQAHTNTYADVGTLEALYMSAIRFQNAIGLDIATRADCLGDDICALLADISQRTDLTVELGLQSSNDATAALINRGHDFATFCDGYARLRRMCPRAMVCIHLILGLPGETDEMMLQTVRDTAALRPDMVKLHLLHVLKGTELSRIYAAGQYIPLTREHYVSLIVSALELLPPATIVARLTGDGLSENLIAPQWSRQKTAVINDIDKLMYSENTYQGRLYESSRS